MERRHFHKGMLIETLYHPDDRSLLAMVWEEWVLIDTVQPFGLQLISKVISAVAEHKCLLTLQDVIF